MAFDRPIEADRVDNLGLLSSFVRAPFVAPIMWAIGGLLPEEKENATTKQQQQYMDLGIENESCTANLSNNFKQPSQETTHDTIEILIESVIQNNTSSNSLLRRSTAGNLENLSKLRSQDGDQHEDLHSTQLWQRKKNRKMSWSDESGQDLVQYCIEPSCQIQEEGNASTPQVSSKASSNHKKPMKSAMRHGSRRHKPSQCIPSMPPSVNGYAASTNNKGGYISPQWGWYISTTPPTPEYYVAGSQRNQVLSHAHAHAHAHAMNTNNLKGTHHQNVNNNNPGSHHDYVGKRPCNPSTSTIEESSRPLFTKGPLKYSSGWPTVPL